MNAYKSEIAELLGTFGLVFIGAGAVLVNALTGGAVGLVGIALAHGLILMAMIYALAGISGAHFNPAVTVALWAQRRVSSAKAARYILFQLVGASLAALLLSALFPAASAEQLYGFPLQMDWFAAIGLEAALTFFLASAVYGLAINPKAPAQVFGLGIGLTVAAAIFVGGPFTGAALNPARAFGPALATGLWGPQLIYWLGPILGALLSSLVWEYLLDEKVRRK